jgi:hypothetical protein
MKTHIKVLLIKFCEKFLKDIKIVLVRACVQYRLLERGPLKHARKCDHIHSRSAQARAPLSSGDETPYMPVIREKKKLLKNNLQAQNYFIGK